MLKQTITDLAGVGILGVISIGLVGIASQIAMKQVVDRGSALIDPLVDAALSKIKTKDFWAKFDHVREDPNTGDNYSDWVSLAAEDLGIPLLSKEGFARLVAEVNEMDEKS